MTNLLEKISAQLRYYSYDELIALVRDFLVDLDEREQTRFLNLVTKGPRPVVAEAMGLGEIDDFLDDIEDLRQAIANDEYVEYGAGRDSDYGEYHGFGDDGWIGDVDNLLATATSSLRTGQFGGVVETLRASFVIFNLELPQCSSESI